MKGHHFPTDDYDYLFHTSPASAVAYAKHQPRDPQILGDWRQ